MMKKLLISALLLSPTIGAVTKGDKLVDALQEIAQSTNLVDDTIDAIQALNKTDVLTFLRRLDCSDRSQEEKVAVLTKLYAIATEVTDQWEKIVSEAAFYNRYLYGSKILGLRQRN